MKIMDILKKIRRLYIHCLEKVRTKLLGYPKDCRIESGCKLRNTILDGRNHIGANCMVYNTVMGFASGISSNSIIDSFKIGKFTTFGPDVKIITGQHPTSKIVSTYPAFYSNRAQMGFTYVNRTIFNEFKYVDEQKRFKVVVGNDVWIGSYVKIVEGITIGDGAVIAAGAIVTNDVPPYAVVGGIPAKIIKYRFDEQNIIKLLDLKWWDKKQEWIAKHAIYFEDVNILMKVVNLNTTIDEGESHEQYKK